MNPSKTPAEILDIGDAEVRVSNPDKVVFPEPGLTKLDLVRYYTSRPPRKIYEAFIGPLADVEAGQVFAISILAFLIAEMLMGRGKETRSTR